MELMIEVWPILEWLYQQAQRSPSSVRVWSTCSGGCLWTQDTDMVDGTPVLVDCFTRTRAEDVEMMPCNLNNILAQAILAQAIEAWRITHQKFSPLTSATALTDLMPVKNHRELLMRLEAWQVREAAPSRYHGEELSEKMRIESWSSCSREISEMSCAKRLTPGRLAGGSGTEPGTWWRTVYPWKAPATF